MSTGARLKETEEAKAKIRPQSFDPVPAATVSLDQAQPSPEARVRSGILFRAIWYAGNVLLILAVLLAAYAAVWEYSTRKYLKGFSDAVVPASASPEEKAQAILHWMSAGPARRDSGPVVSSTPDREPMDTLNYSSLLRVCGSATNAFVNLADSAGLASRRLLLLDSRRITRHVVAEVFVNGRWIVVDPAFRTILRGDDGHALTREELRDPAIFAAATSRIPGYSPDYTYGATVHVRLARLGWARVPIRYIVGRLIPGWEDSTVVSLMLERESLATLAFSLVLLFLLGLFRVGLRWYGESRLGVNTLRVRQQFRRAFEAFIGSEG